MKKITFLVLVLISFCSYAQVINQPANWPNNSWTITGTYDASPNVFTDNPTVSSNFSFDDDEPGSSSDNDIAAESPVIDLTAAFNAGEFGVELTSTYVLNTYQTETLVIQYWNADSNSWVNWSNPTNDNTPNAPNVDFCAGPSASFNSGTLNIAGFSANQLANFRYRIYYQDNGSWGWGFCFNSPTIYSGNAPTCPNVTNLFVSNVTTNSAVVQWTEGGNESQWEIVIQAAGTGLPSSGTILSNPSPYFAPGLTPDTDYELFLRARCAANDLSSWSGPVNFSTLPPSRINFSQVNISVSGYDLGVVDMNGDFLDDIVGVSATNINIQQQNANGTFTERNLTTPSADYLPSWSMAAADFNADGYTDLLYGAGQGVTFMRSNGDGTTFTEQSTIPVEQYTFSQRSNFVDINNDGNLDAFVCHDVEPNVYFMNDSQGLGNLTFFQSDVTPDAPYSLGNYPSGGDYGSIWIDYNNDRNIDLFVAKCGGSEARRTNILITNNGDGTYTENAASKNLADPMQTWSSAWGDFDNDGDMDVFVGASSGSHKLMRNNGGPFYTFTDVTAGAGISAPTGWESSTFDIDNDGYLDIISNGSIMYGKGDMTFEDADVTQINYKNGSFGDLNNDGFIDVYYNGTIYYNLGNSNNWVKINTIGMGHQTPNMSNRNGIGARVEVRTAAGTQLRDVRSGEGFEFMSSLNTHFGLGSETEIISITIYWPSGTVDVITNPAINTTHTIIEGDTLSIIDETLTDLSIYPNPVEDDLQIVSATDVTDKIATVFDMNGKRIINTKLNSNSLNVSSLQSGVYFLRLESDGKSIKRKFIKK